MDANKPTDTGLVHLKPLMTLQHLNLSYCTNLTDAGLAHFKNLTTSLNLKLSK
ncbi:hypothetical protein DB44_DA00030 [Candidatus Protochlamydia amoebophila]|uniref:F-box/LRR-repeat protein 14 n=1 Tax=Candidatus Protochlamydia amoebophila TaxID=362787 RepID=A0A0C1H235_9BACT|nr:hypothetical protein DB44_DA00030 [Candidatus Protochlamydia amoebophila]